MLYCGGCAGESSTSAGSGNLDPAVDADPNLSGPKMESSGQMNFGPAGGPEAPQGEPPQGGSETEPPQ